MSSDAYPQRPFVRCECCDEVLTDAEVIHLIDHCIECLIGDDRELPPAPPPEPEMDPRVQLLLDFDEVPF